MNIEHKAKNRLKKSSSLKSQVNIKNSNKQKYKKPVIQKKILGLVAKQHPSQQSDYFQKSKTPPLLKRSCGDEQSPIYGFTNSLKHLVFNDKIGSLKLHSDEQSTKIFNVHKCEQNVYNQDPYKIKSNTQLIKITNDLSISLILRKQKKDNRKTKQEMNSQTTKPERDNKTRKQEKSIKNKRQKSFKKQSLRTMKSNLQASLSKYKSLKQFHMKQCQYYHEILTQTQSKRLKLIQSLQKQQIKDKIANLKEKMQQKIKNKQD